MNTKRMTTLVLVQPSSSACVEHQKPDVSWVNQSVDEQEQQARCGGTVVLGRLATTGPGKQLTEFPEDALQFHVALSQQRYASSSTSSGTAVSLLGLRRSSSQSSISQGAAGATVSSSLIRHIAPSSRTRLYMKYAPAEWIDVDIGSLIALLCLFQLPGRKKQTRAGVSVPVAQWNPQEPLVGGQSRRTRSRSQQQLFPILFVSRFELDYLAYCDPSGHRIDAIAASVHSIPYSPLYSLCAGMPTDPCSLLFLNLQRDWQ